tara:strand:+ start:4130 stop:6679 length:2550 start_codon:yes stop_codon:yes gene_type:complete
MSINKCLIEVQSAVKDVFNDEEARDILNKIQSKLDEKRTLKELGTTEDKIAKEILEEEKKIKLIKKRNTLNARIKVYEHFAKGIEHFNGKPIEHINSLLVGTSSSKKFSQFSTDNKQVLYRNKYKSGFETEISNLGLDDLIVREELQPFIFIEHHDNPFLKLTNQQKKIMIENNQPIPKDEPITGNQNAYDIAKIGKKYNDMALDDKNSLGAYIKRDSNYVFRTSHVGERMMRAAGDDVTNEAVHKAKWIEDIKNAIDLDRDFKGKNDNEINKSLGNAWSNILSGHTLTALGTSSRTGSRNIATRLSAEKIFHFKDGKSFFEYNQKYGHGDYVTSLEQGFLKSGQDAGLMDVLSTNPEKFLGDLVSLYQNHYGGSIAKDLSVEKFRKNIMELDGSINVGHGNTLAKVGSVIGAAQEVGKLTAIAPTSFFGDIPNIMTQVKHDDMNVLSSMNIVFSELFRSSNKKELKQVLQPFGLFVDNFVSGLNQHATINEDMVGSVAKFKAGFYKWTGFKALMERMKSGVFLAYQNHYGILAKENNWNQLSEQTQRVLGLYGVDDGMWNMMRKTTLRKFEGYDLLTIDDLAELPKNNIIDYLKKTQPTLTKFSDTKIRETRNEIQSRWRMFLYSRVHMGILEPGARERAYLNQGLPRGSSSGFLARLITKFKSFPTTVYTKKLEVLVKGSGEDIKASNYIPALTYYTILGTVFGYASLSFADMLAGKEPRDPTDPKTMAASMAKGGGASIMGDLLYQEISRSNGGAASTILGPAFSDLEGLMNVLKNTAQGKFDKAGLKAYRLFEANTPIDIWYLRPVYNFLIGYHIKDILDPGYFDRLEGYTKKATGQDFYNYIKP